MLVTGEYRIFSVEKMPKKDFKKLIKWQKLINFFNNIDFTENS